MMRARCLVGGGELLWLVKNNSCNGIASRAKGVSMVAQDDLEKHPSKRIAQCLLT